ncbi:hypothetical protein IFM47457_05179 [Aspergillus lentulus]|nr:hypothetical protein IFM47457_05179 [Aspergillus lentulus]
MDVPCPILETYLATIRPTDSALSTELDRIGAARAEGQENQFRLSAPGITDLSEPDEDVLEKPKLPDTLTKT